MKSTVNEIYNRSGKRQWLKKAVTLALALGLSGFFYGGVSYAAGIEDSSEKGGGICQSDF